MADDQSTVRDMARRILEPAGYQILEARDGAEAATMLNHGTQVDLLQPACWKLSIFPDYRHVNKPKT